VQVSHEEKNCGKSRRWSGVCTLPQQAPTKEVHVGSASKTPPGKGNIGDIGQKLSADLRELGGVVAERRNIALAGVLTFVNERPITALGIAFGVGYILAGGLFSRATGRVLRLGGRLMLGRLVREAVIGAGLGALADMGERSPSEVH
jgi:hypothetical protein